MSAPAKREPEKAPAKAAKPSLVKSKKFLVLMVCLLAVVGAGYKMMAPAPKAGPPKGGDVVAMEATTLNLADGHYLKIAVAIQLVKGKATKDSFEGSQAAELVIDEFSNRTVASLSSNASRTRLMDELEIKLKKAYPGEVFRAFVTQFVTQ